MSSITEWETKHILNFYRRTKLIDEYKLLFMIYIM